MTETGQRVVNTPDLNVLWRKAGPGKRPSRVFMDRLDFEGLHVLWVEVPFMNDTMEHRLRGYAKTKESDEPVLFQMDMLVSDFNRLLKASTLLAQAKGDD